MARGQKSSIRKELNPLWRRKTTVHSANAAFVTDLLLYTVLFAAPHRFLVSECTGLGFTNFPSGRFTIATLVNPTEGKLVSSNTVQCRVSEGGGGSRWGHDFNEFSAKSPPQFSIWPAAPGLRELPRPPCPSARHAYRGRCRLPHCVQDRPATLLLVFD